MGGSFAWVYMRLWEGLVVFLAEQEANERRWHSDKKDTFSVSLQTKLMCFWGEVVLEI